MKTRYVKPDTTVMRFESYGSLCAGSVGLRSVWGQKAVMGRSESWQNEGYMQQSFKGGVFIGAAIENDNGTISSQGKGGSIWDE